MKYFVFLTVLIFVFYLLGFIKKPEKHQWMDRNYTTAIKGFSILTVVRAHSGAKLSVGGIQFIAGIGVALFLMCSGYGLEISYEKNGLKGFWKKRLLSVQVHPTDAYAQERENGQLGKTEMWYVLDASKDAKLVYGLKRERTEQQMREAIAKGTLMKDLQWVPVKKDDLFFIEAGTIHAIGAGALVAEIQENSNLTYRLYDYDRVGKDGKKRELHVDKALQVANLKGSAEPRQPLRVLKYRQGLAYELLTRCKYFEVYRMIVNTERRQKVHYRADEIVFRVLLCVNGCGTISYEGGNLPFYKGDCIFVPADSEVLTIHGQAQFLDVRG